MKVQLFDVLKKAQIVRMHSKTGIIKPSIKHDGKYAMSRYGVSRDLWFADQECEMDGNVITAINWVPPEGERSIKAEPQTFEVFTMTPLDEEEFV